VPAGSCSISMSIHWHFNGLWRAGNLARSWLSTGSASEARLAPPPEEPAGWVLHSFLSSNLCCIWLHGFRAKTQRDRQDRQENTRVMPSVAVFRVWRGMLHDVALVAFGCAGAVGSVLYFFGFQRAWDGIVSPSRSTVTRWRWQFGWSEGAGRLFSMRPTGGEMCHRIHGATANTVPRPAVPPAVVVP
jgi:hypothetical protein